MFTKAYIFILHITNIFTYRHQIQLDQKLWSDGCKKNSMALNDCNWCLCDSNQRYHCKARLCEEIDMFGHFKDAIREIDVGMEGHGSWRSLPTPCTPSVYYRRGDVLCLCDEDGNWPNPVCRDIFRVIHTIEGIYQDIVINRTCSPRKLYLVGCNVCFCSLSGKIDLDLCTKKECEDDDPALPQNQVTAKSSSKVSHQETSEIYASCDPNYKYDLGCKSCFCLKKNRLLCNNCTKSRLALDTQNLIIRRGILNKYKNHKKQNRQRRKIRKVKKKKEYSICDDRRIDEKFEIDCNICFCDEDARLFCTIRACISISVEAKKVNLKLSNIDKRIIPPKVKTVARPLLDDMCIPGTTYKKECNICICIKVQNVKVFDCSLKKCSKEKTAIELQQNDCVIGKVYKMNCQICYCYTIERVKHQICQFNPECERERRHTNIMEGYCQPLYYFKKDCNTCRCLSDGKTIVCSSKICSKRTSEPLTVDLVPIQMQNSESCPKGHSYRLECNLCFCLTNGNAICTTVDCSGEDEGVPMNLFPYSKRLPK